MQAVFTSETCMGPQGEGSTLAPGCFQNQVHGGRFAWLQELDE